MITSLVARPVQVYDLPIPAGSKIPRPEQAILRFEHGKTIDVGSLCYLERDFSAVRYRRSFDGRKVRLASHSPDRVAEVRALIMHCSEQVQDSGLRAETVRDLFSRFIAFMSWADTNGWQEVLSGETVARAAIKAYVAYLWERVRRNEITINSGESQQTSVVTVLEGFLGSEGLTRGINLLRKSPSAKTATCPPSHGAQARVLSLCEAVFVGLSALVLEEKSYPFALAMPKYLRLPADRLWIFPSSPYLVSPLLLAAPDTDVGRRGTYNYQAGRLSTLEELRAIKGFAGESDVIRQQLIRSARRQLEAANENPQHMQRRRAAVVAANMFIILFLAQTGMNWAQLTELPWSDEYDVTAKHQAFRTIKWRAGGKLVSFELPIAFMPSFKHYLKLRKYLLSGEKYDLLFFRMGPEGRGEPSKMKSGLTTTYNMLRRIDPTLPAVHSRQWRAAKSDWLVRNTDVSTAALVLQNSEKTVLASYAEGPMTHQLEEMTTFLDQVSSMVVAKSDDVYGAVSRAVGMCSGYGAPNPMAGSVTIQPDCKGPEGCLFCDKFKVHADERDTRKLLSCRYCLRQTASLVGSVERLQSLITPIFDRIELIVAEVTRREPDMVQKVTREVDEEGELDPYWARKLEMLMELGVVTCD